jgi:hypothetical protein
MRAQQWAHLRHAPGRRGSLKVSSIPNAAFHTGGALPRMAYKDRVAVALGQRSVQSAQFRIRQMTETLFIKGCHSSTLDSSVNDQYGLGECSLG